VQKALDRLHGAGSRRIRTITPALTNSALLHKQQGDRAEAIRKLELATKVAPDQPLAFTNLGQTYFEAGSMPKPEGVRERDPAAGLDRRARRSLSDRDPDRRHGAGRAAGLRRRGPARRSGHGRDPHVRRDLSRAHEGSRDLAADFQARALALSRPQAAGNGILQLAISEALFGLIDQAKARVDKAEETASSRTNTARRSHGRGGDRKDAAMARQLMARRSSDRRSTAATIRRRRR
jgi:tetratricopeptide (TPR) repeat protein